MIKLRSAVRSAAATKKMKMGGKGEQKACTMHIHIHIHKLFSASFYFPLGKHIESIMIFGAQNYSLRAQCISDAAFIVVTIVVCVLNLCFSSAYLFLAVYCCSIAIAINYFFRPFIATLCVSQGIGWSHFVANTYTHTRTHTYTLVFSQLNSIWSSAHSQHNIQYENMFSVQSIQLQWCWYVLALIALATRCFVVLEASYWCAEHAEYVYLCVYIVRK